jgi:hypothetical protein
LGSTIRGWLEQMAMNREGYGVESLFDGLLTRLEETPSIELGNWKDDQHRQQLITAS